MLYECIKVHSSMIMETLAKENQSSTEAYQDHTGSFFHLVSLKTFWNKVEARA